MQLLNDMALFVEVVKARSFRRAAETIGMPNSTLSRRITLLEKEIGLRLLHRTTRRLELTEAGQLYFEQCRRIVDEARLAHEQLGTMLAQPTGLLRVSLPVDFANTYLAPLIAQFAEAYPGITFEFDLTPRRVDLVTEPFDVAIRMGDQPDSSLIARRLAALRRYLYASPAYLERHGDLNQPEDLRTHEFLRLLGPAANMVTLQHGERTEVINVGGRFKLNSVGLIRRLAGQGLGIAVLAEDIAAEDVSEGRLRKVLPEWQSPPIPVYAVTETRLLPAKTQRFVEFLQECLKRA